MGRKRYPPDDPREWLNRAHSNLALAGAFNPQVMLEDLCFDAQQTAEKAIKAVFIDRGEDFPYVHDLKKLLDLLARNGLTIPKYVRQAQDLSPFAGKMRYPNRDAPVSQRQYRRALRIATAVLGWAERQVAAGAKKPGGTK